MQLRRDRAANFIKIDRPIGEKFGGVLNNYLRYVTPDFKDKNKWRWETQDFWLKFVKTTEKISIYTKKNIEYNLSRVERYIFNQAGNSIETYIKCLGVSYFLTALEKRDTHLMIHHKSIIENYKKEVDKNFGVIEHETQTFRGSTD